MMRSTIGLMQQFRKSKGKVDLKTSFTRTTSFNRARKQRLTTVDGEVVEGSGKVRIRSHDVLKKEIESMEHPAIWMWYPWRKNPEPPQPFFPQRRALKNLHGALYSDLSPAQKKRQEELHFGMGIDSRRQTEFEAKHPFLQQILKSQEGAPKGFPFWYKKYPTRNHAYENRFNIPMEMLDGYPENIRKAVSHSMMTVREKEAAQRAKYMERYAQHDFDTNSAAVSAVRLALICRSMRNHLLTNPHNNIMKTRLGTKERQLNRSLRRLRKEDFRKYWEVLRDHDVQDVIQPPNAVSYRWGSYWMFDWNKGMAITTNISDFMDPRGLNGCVETGRSRGEVARDLGLSYTRPLMDNEKRQLEQNATYYARLATFKAEQPEHARQLERERFVRKFSGVYVKMAAGGAVHDFPSKNRHLIGTKVLRWKSKRHGPM
jgi:ribosomal protein S15P/S13E